MSTFTQFYYHIIFAPKYREPVLLKPNLQRLHRYLWKTLEEKRCHPYAIGGTEDHLHIFTHVHSQLAVAPLVKDLKLATSGFIGAEGLFPQFKFWQEGYAAFTKSHEAKEDLVRYVLNQEEHHKNESSKDELRRLLWQAGVRFDERYLE